MRIENHIMLNIIFVIAAVAFGYQILSRVEASEPANLTILGLIPFSGNEPRNGLVCRAAMQVAVDLVNETPEILPSYHVTARYRNEAPNGEMDVQETILFQRRALTGGVRSALIVGPFFSTGCGHLSDVLDQINMVALATGCKAVTSDRGKNPNLYRLQMLDETEIHARLKLLQTMGWKRVAILSNVNYMRDYQISIRLQQILVANGIQVSAFEYQPGTADDSSMMMALKQSDLRIVILQSTLVDPLIRFLCSTYKYGITGSKYVFIALTIAMFDPSSGPLPGCSTAILMEQLKYTIFTGSPMFPADNKTVVSSLGLTVKGYSQLLDGKTGSSRSPDYMIRYLCFDTMLAGLMILDKAEKRLQAKNLGLGDYDDNPPAVMEAVHKSVATMEFDGFRVGRQEYVPNMLEMDSETQVVLKFHPADNSFVLHAQLTAILSTNASSKRPPDFNFEILQPFNWPRGKIPGDFPSTSTIPVTSKFGNPIITTVFSVLAFVLQTVVLAFNLKYHKGERRCSKRILQLTLYFGWQCINASSVVSVLISRMPTLALCYGRFFLNAAGLPLVNSSLLSVIICCYCSQTQPISPACKPVKKARKNAHLRVNGRINQRRKNGNSVKFSVRKAGKYLVLFVGLFSFISLTSAVIWIILDPPRAIWQQRYLGPKYDPIGDSYINEIYGQCASIHQMIWFAGQTAYQLPVLVIGHYVYYKSNRAATKEMKQYGTAQLNMGTIMLLLFVLLGVSGLVPFQTAIQSMLSLTLSFVTFLLTSGKTAFDILIKSDFNTVRPPSINIVRS